MMARIRELFKNGEERDRDEAIRELARGLGYKRIGKEVRKALNGLLMTAVRRGIIKNERGVLTIDCPNVTWYEEDFLKEMFLAGMGRGWWERETAIVATARYLGFRRVGPRIRKRLKSIINGLIRKHRLETNGSQIRKTSK